MDVLALYLAHPFWWWVGVGVLLLAVEVATGTDQLLWPSASAGVVAAWQGLGLPLSPGLDVGLFAVLTIASTLLARRYLRRPAAGPDVNDRVTRLVGGRGEAVTAFQNGQGRVFVDGAEWAAEAQGDASIDAGARVEVVEVLDGGRLLVKLAA